MQDITLWVGGMPATEIAAHTPPTSELIADGGTLSISFAMNLSARSQHPALRPGSLVEAKVGGLRVARGVLSDPDRTTWECVAQGLHTAGFLALDASGNVTRDLGVAITQAIARGWRVTNPSGVGTGYTVPGNSTEPQTVTSLLDQAAQAQGMRWGVSPRGYIYMAADPTTVSLNLAPDAAVFGTTDEGAATHLAGRFYNGTAYQTTIRPTLATAYGNRIEEPVDLTGDEWGTLTLAQANAILDGELAKRGQVNFTNGVTLTREQVTTNGGTPVFLPAIAPRVLARAHGLISARASVQTPFLDFIVGKVRYTAGEDSIYLEPAGASPIAGGLAGVIAAS